MNRRDFISKSIPASGTLAYQGSAPFLQGKEAKSNVVNGFTYELPKFKNGARLLFQGDSITDMNWGRNQKDRNHYLGHSYVFLLASCLGVDMAEANLEFFNRGVSGNKVSDLRKRWHKDAIEMNPDWLSILVGVNDVSQGRGQPIDLKKWEGDYRHILNESRKINPDLNIVLMDPFVLRMTRLSPDDQWKYWRGEIDKLGQIVSRMAKDFDAVHIETQKIFDQAARYTSPQHWIWDGVHPLPQGHELIARNWLQAVAKATNK
jgi:lysophospholipase L1-like esterase